LWYKQIEELIRENQELREVKKLASVKEANREEVDELASLTLWLYEPCSYVLLYLDTWPSYLTDLLSLRLV